MSNQPKAGGFWCINNSETIVAMWEPFSENEQIDYKIFADNALGEFNYIGTATYNYFIMPAEGVSRIYIEAYNKYGTFLRTTQPINVPVTSNDAIDIIALRSYRGVTLNWSMQETFAPYYFMRKSKGQYHIMSPMHMFQITLDKVEEGSDLKILECTPKGAPYKVSRNFIFSEDKFKKIEKPSEIKVSVVIPIYNNEKYCSLSIDSVLCSTLKDIEIILVDDCSTDNSLEIAKWYEENYPEVVRVIHNEKNLGAAGARNKGIEAAKGEFISFVDSDDVIGARMLEELYNSAVKNECDMSVCEMLVLDPQDLSSARLAAMPYEGGSVRPVEDLLFATYRKQYANVSVCNKIYRTPLVKEHPLPEFLYEDSAWSPVIYSYADKFFNTAFPFYCYNRNISQVQKTLTNVFGEMTEKQRVEERLKSYNYIINEGNQSKRDYLMLLAVRLVVRQLIASDLPVEEGQPFKEFMLEHKDEINSNLQIDRDDELQEKIKFACKRYDFSLS